MSLTLHSVQFLNAWCSSRGASAQYSIEVREKREKVKGTKSESYLRTW